ncbi:MAG: hypothetical protein KA974_09860 [Saprospiraceae bacterium]|nr:hypothetical protein [Saprospiraceae bacterium]MBP7679884.1 hypothetical protein [Saprospiraceae bacterium]
MRIFTALLLIFLHITLQAMPNVADTLSFPATWVGNWRGNLHIYNATGKTQTIPMQLCIAQQDSIYTWNIIYGEDAKDNRLYHLLTLDATKGYYLLDEQNSIRMEHYFIGDKLYSWFTVQGTQLLSTTALVGDSLIYEIVFGNNVAVSKTGNQQVNGEDIPTVETFPIKGVQKATLHRQD